MNSGGTPDVAPFPELQEFQRRLLVNGLKVWRGEFGPVRVGKEALGLWHSQIDSLLQLLGESRSWNTSTDKCPHGVAPTFVDGKTCPNICSECAIAEAAGKSQAARDDAKSAEEFAAKEAERADRAEALAEGRRVALLEKAEEARREWQRAENALGQVEALQKMNRDLEQKLEAAAKAEQKAWNESVSQKNRADHAESRTASSDPERVAQLIAHRACGGDEHDPANGRLHGNCVVCLVPWPCEYAGKPPAAAPAKDSVDCAACEGRGRVGIACQKCGPGNPLVDCGACKNTGIAQEVDCDKCAGSGKVPVET